MDKRIGEKIMELLKSLLDVLLNVLGVFAGILIYVWQGIKITFYRLNELHILFTDKVTHKDFTSVIIYIVVIFVLIKIRIKIYGDIEERYKECIHDNLSHGLFGKRHRMSQKRLRHLEAQLNQNRLNQQEQKNQMDERKKQIIREAEEKRLADKKKFEEYKASLNQNNQ